MMRCAGCRQTKPLIQFEPVRGCGGPWMLQEFCKRCQSSRRWWWARELRRYLDRQAAAA